MYIVCYIAVDVSLATTVVKGALPVHIVARRGHNELMKLLIRYGASIDVEDGEGKTPLILACQVYTHTHTCT